MWMYRQYRYLDCVDICHLAHRRSWTSWSRSRTPTCVSIHSSPQLRSTSIRTLRYFWWVSFVRRNECTPRKGYTIKLNFWNDEMGDFSIFFPVPVAHCQCWRFTGLDWRTNCIGKENKIYLSDWMLTLFHPGNKPHPWPVDHQYLILSISIYLFLLAKILIQLRTPGPQVFLCRSMGIPCTLSSPS